MLEFKAECRVVSLLRKSEVNSAICINLTTLHSALTSALRIPTVVAPIQ